MNKRKILGLALALCMVAILAIGGTLAYFTDSDADTNVMTVGNVDIAQHEKDDNGNPFEQDQPMLPAPSDEYNSENHVDKVITVENTGSLPAYVRTILAFEDNKEGTITSQLHTLWNGSINKVSGLQENYGIKPSSKYDVVWMQNTDGSWMTITDGTTTYTIAIITYPAALAAGETSAPSLMEIWLDDAATNEFSTLVNGNYNIIALSQAVQADGMTDADTAFETAYGAVTEASLTEWFAGTPRAD